MFFKSQKEEKVEKIPLSEQDFNIVLETIAVPPPPNVDLEKAFEDYKKQTIDWTDPNCKISKYFTVREAILLRNWNRLGNEQDGLSVVVKNNLLSIFSIMDKIREILGVPVYIKSAWRPKKYNVEIGGATKSSHMADDKAAAVDFWCDLDGDNDKDGDDCDKIKAILMPKLQELGIRMEDNGKGARWVHIDNKAVPPKGNRFFKPI